MRADQGSAEAGRAPCRVVLFGEIVADVFPDRSVLGGAPFNVARHLAGFGQEAGLISRIGPDALGREALELMRRDRMDRTGVQLDDDKPSGQVRVVMAGGTHRFEILDDQAYDYIRAGEGLALVWALTPELVYFGTLCQRRPVSRQSLATVLDATPARRFLDINLRQPWYDRETVEWSLSRAHVLKLNNDELAILAEMLALPGTTEQDRAAALRLNWELQAVVVTCGEQGAWLLDDGGLHTTPVVHPERIVDTVGAGDGFSAVTIIGMLSGWPVPLTLQRANAFAAAVCGVRGAIPEDDGFYTRFLKEWI